jgi:Subtilase family
MANAETIAAMAVRWLPDRAPGLVSRAGGRSRRSRLAWLLALIAIGSAAGCGGGGGGGGGGGSGGLLPASSFETTEYHANYGLGVLRASSAYAAGATGRGITVGVVDTGIDVDHPEFAGQIAAASTDIMSGDPQLVDDIDGHGTAVAGVIAARRNQALTHGVAFQAKLLAVRADAPGTCPGSCAFDQADVAAATDYAVAHGAQVINYSLGGSSSLGAALHDAFARAVDAGTILVLAAGNEAAAEPSFPGRFAADPAADDQVIAVGAVDANKQIASFSNRAGSAQDHYLVAPGVSVLAPKLGGGAALVSGTSFAAPHVSGAAALVLDAAPFLSAAEVVQLLLDTATDLGAPGPDPVYGQGLVNLRAALGPQGTLSVPLGSTVGEAGAALGDTGLRLGPAFGRGPDLGAVIFLDGYGRPYWLDLEDRIGVPATAPDLAAWLTPAEPQYRVTMPLGPALALDLTVARPAGGGVAAAAPGGPADGSGAAFALDFGPGDLAEGGATRLAVTHGLGLQNRFGLMSVDPVAAGGLLGQAGLGSPYLALADRGDGMVLAQEVGPQVAVRLGVAVGETDRQPAAAQSRNAVVIGELVRSFGPGRVLSLQVGSVDEQHSLLDTRGSGALGGPDGATTTFFGLAGDWALADRFTLFGQASLGTTDPGTTGRGLFEEVSALWSSSFAAGLGRRDLFADGDQLTLAAVQPLRVEAGSAVIDRPVGRSFDGRILRQRDQVDLAPEGREIDLEVGYRLALSGRWTLGLNWLTQLEPGHQPDAGPAHAAAIRLRTAL